MLKDQSKAGRAALVFMGVWLIAIGCRSIFMRHDFSHENWYHGLVFAPVAILAGVICMMAAIWYPSTRRRRK